MDQLPADAHRYLASFVDVSTGLLLPLTCKCLYASLGFHNFSLQTAVSAAAKDDNLQLMLYFLRDRTSHRYKSFYMDSIFYPILKGNSIAVATWYCKQRYTIPDHAHWFTYEMMTSVPVLDKLFHHKKLTYDGSLLAKVIRYDRVDILYSRYIEREEGAPQTTAMLNITHLQTMLAKGAFHCFLYFSHFLKANVGEIIGLEQAIVNYGSTNIVDHFLQELKKCGDVGLDQEVINALLANPNYHSTQCFDLFNQEYSLTYQQSLSIIRDKQYPVASKLLRDVCITEEHCHAALDRECGPIINYVFSRFDGKLTRDQSIYRSFNSVGDFNVRLVAEKLTSVRCLLHVVLYQKATDIFQRLAEETQLVDVSFAQLMPYQHCYPEAIKIYFSYRTISDEEQVKLHAVYGTTFLDVLRQYEQKPCSRLRKKVRNNERRKSLREKEPAKKRQRTSRK